MTSYTSILMETPQRPILLVFSPAAPDKKAGVDRFLDRASPVLTSAVQLVRVSEKTHPEVVRSFGFSAMPGFVLLQRGLELWRYTGPADRADLLDQLENQLKQSIPTI